MDPRLRGDDSCAGMTASRGWQLRGDDSFAGYDLKPEYSASAGRIDLILQTPDKILVMEFKLTKYGSATDALQQIKDKRYADQFQADKRPVCLIGMSSDDLKKEMQQLIWEKVWYHPVFFKTLLAGL